MSPSKKSSNFSGHALSDREKLSKHSLRGCDAARLQEQPESLNTVRLAGARRF